MKICLHLQLPNVSSKDFFLNFLGYSNLQLFCYNKPMKNLDNINDWLDVTEHQKIGEIFMQCGMLTLDNLGTALDIQNFEKMQLGDILINMKVITEDELKKALKLQKQIDETFASREG